MERPGEKPEQRISITDIVHNATGVGDITRAASQRVHATTERDASAFKVERFTLLVFLLEHIFRKMEETKHQRPPWGLWLNSEKHLAPNQMIPLCLLDSSRPFISLQVGMGRTFTYFVETVLDELETSPEEGNLGTLKKMFQRYKMLTEGGIDPLGNVEDGARGIMGGGVITAVTTMAGILEIIPTVYQRASGVSHPDHRVLTDIARASYPTILKLAMLHIDNLQANIFGLFDPEERFIFGPSLFRLEGSSDSPHLILHKKILDHMAHNPSHHAVPPIGCPAHVNMAPEGSIIKRLWDWHIEIAEDIYRNMDHGMPVESRRRVKIVSGSS